MVAAENGALPGAKVGGVGDVVRELPVALAELGWRPLVLTPGYGLFDGLAGARRAAAVELEFGGAPRSVAVLQVPGPDPRVEHAVFEHALLAPGGPGVIYNDDGAHRPFATDAGKFALFSAATAHYVAALDEAPEVVHLHDWHAALYTVLRAYDPALARLKAIRTVYTIHNLAMQGIRPFANDPSSMRTWFPDLDYDEKTLVDPRYPDCVNPMAAAIRLADRVNTVSPTYAREILLPSDPARGFSGGEGLEDDLARASHDGRLFGILNGCEYPKRDRRRPGWWRLLDSIGGELANWLARGDDVAPIHELARTRLAALPRRRPPQQLTSIGRLTSQKVALFLADAAPGRSALEAILDALGKRGVFILLGSGDRTLQQRIGQIAAAHDNFLFLCGYSLAFTDTLYKAGDLFLMPSSFEPCGISQMLAMREGQPCVVHAVGGLKDTVKDGVNGFTFAGDSPGEQAANFVATVARAMAVHANDPDRWLRLRDRAARERFSWQTSAGDYMRYVYE